MHQNIDVIEKKPSNIAGGSLLLKCKDFRMIKLDIASTDDLNNVAETLENIKAVSGSNIPLLLISSYLNK